MTVVCLYYIALHTNKELQCGDFSSSSSLVLCLKAGLNCLLIPVMSVHRLCQRLTGPTVKGYVETFHYARILLDDLMRKLRTVSLE